MLTCASEKWTINLLDKRKIESVEIWFLSPVAIAGYTLLDNIRNTDIHLDLNIFSLTEKIERYKENWHENILRMKPIDSRGH
jgi:hypothetical protein